MRSHKGIRLAEFAMAATAGLMATSALAQITDVTTRTEAGITLRGPGAGTTVIGPVVNGPDSDYRSDSIGRGAGYSAFAEVDDTFIYFESGTMAANQRNSATSLTEVNIGVTGDTPGGEVDRLISTIFESNFGFYVGAFGDDPLCSGENLPNCAGATSGSGFSNAVLQDNPTRAGMAGTSFSFSVLVDGVEVRKIGGSITMFVTNGVVSFVEDFGAGDNALSSALVGFELEANDDYAYIYQWDKTPFTALFGDASIGFGESAVVTYRITTESWTQSRSNDANAIVAFACFPDPLGKGGATESSGLRGIAAAMDDVVGNPNDATCDDYKDEAGNPERRYSVFLPQIKDGAVVMEPPAVPEPATWGMMIAGFGLVGAAARRRRASALA
jgi:hypothetical protein